MENDAMEKNALTAELLLMIGADPSIEDDLGLTPLCIAAQNNNYHMIETLTLNGSDINYVLQTGHFEGGTVLHFAATCANVDTVKLLIDLGGDISFEDRRGRTPLHWCAEKGNVQVMELLAELCRDLHTSDYGGMTVLHLAAKAGNLEILEWLIDVRKMDIELQNEPGWTPLHTAVASEQVPAIKLLLDKGAYNQAETRNGTTLLFLALRTLNIDVIRLLHGHLSKFP